MYKKILVPVDGSAPSGRGLDEAIKLAKISGGTLELVHVVNEFIMDPSYASPMYHEQMIESLREGGRKILAAAETAVRAQGVACQSAILEAMGGRAAEWIVRRATEWPADLIVMGTHGRRGLRRLALGSDAEMVLRTSPVPVLMVRDAPEAP